MACAFHSLNFTSLLFTSSLSHSFFLPPLLFILSLFSIYLSSDSLYPLFHILSNSGKP